MRIKSVQPGSIAAELDIHPGDRLMAVNGQRIRDEIDYRFFVSDEEVELRVRRNGRTLIHKIQKHPDDLLGIELEEFRTRGCGNHCIFCFADQNPAGMRKNLYFKDEDYRLSFLYGHYTTLTNTSQRDLERIVTQRLTPLYISVHATEWKLRKYLLGLKRPDHLLEKIRFLAEHQIQLHTQIVVCPGVNDREHLIRTVDDLAQFYPAVGSVAVVPVGLTRHRKGLIPLQPVTPEKAEEVLVQVGKFQDHYLPNLGTRFVFPGDEFFLKAGKRIPPSEYYEDYAQIEDGVGMVRLMLETVTRVRPELPVKLAREERVILVSGESASPILRTEILPLLNRIRGFQAQVLPVPNRFFGAGVTVSGLLTGQDIAHALRQHRVGGRVLLSENCLNPDGRFLDDWDLAALQRSTGCSFAILDEFFSDLPYYLQRIQG